MTMRRKFYTISRGIPPQDCEQCGKPASNAINNGWQRCYYCDECLEDAIEVANMDINE
jgi:hypothetical protein